MTRITEMGTTSRNFFQEIYGRFYESLKCRARRIAGTSADRLDTSGLVIEALLKASKNRGGEAGVQNVGAWVSKIITNEVLARLRLARMSMESLTDADRLQARAEEGGLARLERLEREAYLSRLLEQLPSLYRDVICLTEIEEIPDREAASMLGLTAEALRQRRSRGLKLLRELAHKPSRKEHAPDADR